METCDALLDNAAGAIPKSSVMQCPHRLLVRNWILNQRETLVVVDSVENKAFICYGYNELTGCAAGNFISDWDQNSKHTLTCNVLSNLPVRVITVHRDRSAAVATAEKAIAECDLDIEFRYSGAAGERGEASEDDDDEADTAVLTEPAVCPAAPVGNEGDGDSDGDSEEADADTGGGPQKRARSGNRKKWLSSSFQIKKCFDYNAFRLAVDSGSLKVTQELFYRVPTSLALNATNLAKIVLPTYFFDVGAQRAVFAIKQEHYNDYKGRAADLPWEWTTFQRCQPSVDPPCPGVPSCQHR